MRQQAICLGERPTYPNLPGLLESPFWATQAPPVTAAATVSPSESLSWWQTRKGRVDAAQTGNRVLPPSYTCRQWDKSLLFPQQCGGGVVWRCFFGGFFFCWQKVLSGTAALGSAPQEAELNTVLFFLVALSVNTSFTFHMLLTIFLQHHRDKIEAHSSTTPCWI